MKYRALICVILLFLGFSCGDNKDAAFPVAYNPAYLSHLLSLAKAAIREEFVSTHIKKFQEIPYSPDRIGVFIRIIGGGHDRGCVGFYRGVDAIEPAVQAAAVNAAFFDGRYPPLRRGELSVCELEITVIGELKPLSDPLDFDLTTHMLRIEFGKHEAMLQPQIAAQYGYDKEAFLRALCRKAGLQENAYRESGARLFKAQAVFLRMHWADL
jgi:AmmeMemoRadiSam system protein A